MIIRLYTIDFNFWKLLFDCIQSTSTFKYDYSAVYNQIQRFISPIEQYKI